MAVIGTFGSYTAARLGIYASQASLSATGNNIANINTAGYTRQRMDLVSLYSYGHARYANGYQVNIGYGVLTSGVSQLRDPFLDIRYREENASVGAYDEKLNCLQQLADILDEVGKGTEGFGIVEAQFSDFLRQLQNLNGKVGSVEYDTTVRGSAQTLAQLLNSYSHAMDTLAGNKLNELKEDVKTVNSLLTQIRDLNVQIRDAGIVGDNALELRDARNLCIDQLSAYMKIDVSYDMEKIDEWNSVERINISIANSGNPPIKLIQGVYGAQISMDEMAALRNPNFDPKTATKNEFIKGVYVQDGKIVVKYTNNINEAMKRKDEEGNSVPVRNENSEETLDALVKRLEELRDKEIKNAQDAADAEKAKLGKEKTKLEDNRADLQSALDKATDENERTTLQAQIASVNADIKTIEDQITAIDNKLSQDKQDIEKKYNGVDADNDGVKEQDGLIDQIKAVQEDENSSGWNEGDTFFDPTTANAPYMIVEVDEKGKPVLDENGNMKVIEYTWDPERATQVNNAKKDADDNRLWMTVEPLVDIKGRYLRDENHQEIRTSVDLSDTQLYGALQSLREFLTERGEFSSQYDVDLDLTATQKRGLPYYQKALDALAKKFAEAFNNANRLNLEDVSKAYVVDPETKTYLSSSGETINFKDLDGTSIKFFQDIEGKDIHAVQFFKNLTEYTDQIAELKKQLANGEVTREKLAEKQNKLDGLYEQRKALESDPSADTTDLDQQIADLEQQIQDETQEIEAKEKKLTELEDYMEENSALAYHCMEQLRSAGCELTEEWSFYNGGVLFSNNGDTNDPTGITAGNITISEGWTTGSVRILNTKKADGLEHSTANDNILHMIALMSQDMNYYPSEVVDDAKNADTKYFTGSFQERLADMNSILGVDTQTTTLLYNSYTATALSLENSRQSVAGVDLNDEATNMMVYQKAYAAACQLMTTLDSMLDKLINGTLR